MLLSKVAKVAISEDNYDGQVSMFVESIDNS